MDPEVPIRFIYVDGDGGRSGRVFPLKNPYFSRGWGVDPETHGLVIFMGVPSGTVDETYRGWIYGSYVLGREEEIAGAKFGNEELNQLKLDTLRATWYAGDTAHPIIGVFADD